MHDLFVWYLAVELLGLMCLPLTTLALGNLPDKGWALTKPLAVLLVGFGSWLPLVVFTQLPYTRGWIVTIVLLLTSANAVILMRLPEHGRALLAWLKAHWVYALVVEAAFGGAMWLEGWLRSFNPVIIGTEKFMDEAFVASIERAAHLPPPDPWYAGQPINYYYFGHFLIANLAKLLGTIPNIAFNTGIALTAGLTAAGIVGVTTNLSAHVLAATVRRPRGDRAVAGHLQMALPFGLFAAFAFFFFGNLRSFGLWWGSLAAPRGSAALNWLSHAANQTNFDWWNPSRAIPNTITEFPAFSFLLADLHAHVLALPYAVLALGVALNLWLLPRQRGFAALGTGAQAASTLVITGLSIGGLYAMNGWDLPTYLFIALVAMALQQWRAHQFSWDTEFLRDVLLLGGVVLIAVIVPYLPFTLHYVSPGQGIGFVAGTPNHLAVPFAPPRPNAPPVDPQSRTAIGDELAINGLMLFILGSWLVIQVARQVREWLPAWQLRRRPMQQSELAAMGSGTQLHLSSIDLDAPPNGGQTMPLNVGDRADSIDPWGQSWLLVLAVLALLIGLTWLSPLWENWTLIWSLIFVGVAAWLMLRATQQATEASLATVFPLALAGVGAGLIGLCEVVYLRDVFAGSLPRMNTVFKFYFQVWLLFAIGGAVALTWIVAHLADALPPLLARWQPVAFAWRGVWALALLALIGASLIYPIGASRTLYGLTAPHHDSLDGYTPAASSYVVPGDLAAIAWLRAHAPGSAVIVEANSSQADYSPSYARIATFTGIPSIFGWGGHEYQWRVNWLTQGNNATDYNARFNDNNAIYTDKNPIDVLNLLRHYHVTYVYVGGLEEQTYGQDSNISTFASYLPTVYAAGGVTIYGVPSV